jgi:hypothetical protein
MPLKLRIYDIHFVSPKYAPFSDSIFNDGDPSILTVEPGSASVVSISPLEGAAPR